MQPIKFLCIFTHSSTNVRGGGLALSLCANLSQIFLFGSVNQVQHQCLSSMSLWLWLCAVKVMFEKDKLSPNCYHKIKTIELIKFVWYGEAFRILVTGTYDPEKQPHIIFPLKQPLNLAQYSQTQLSCPVSNPNTSFQRMQLCLFTILLLHFGITLSDLWHGCHYSAMKIHPMKLSVSPLWLFRKLRTTYFWKDIVYFCFHC